VNPSLAPVSKRPARKSGVVIPHKPKWHGRLAAFALWTLISALAKTWRVQASDASGLVNKSNAETAIFALWHNRLGIAMEFWRRGQIWQPNARLAALISASRDGGLLAQTFSNFGVLPIRGSSSRRGPQALIELVRVLRQGYHVAITPDGPRGPKYIVQPGIISLAQVSGRPIIPVGAKISSKLQLRSWDQFQVPLPLSRCELLYGQPIRVPREASEAEREQARADLETELRRMNPD
jgi:lysophospholipid acyltransferase (LPLAT)-like uncharacterized protein